MKFGFIAKHRGIWPIGWLCEALGVSRGGFYAWLRRPHSQRSRDNEELAVKVRASFLGSDRAKSDVFDYIERFYNPKRRHSTISYLSPMEFETQAGFA